MDLDKELLLSTFSELNKAAGSGFGVGWDNLNSDPSIKTKIRKNLFLFSGAKTKEQLEAFNNLLVSDEGKILPWNEYRRKVLAIQKEYNINYLQAEYQTAKRSSQAARQWQQFKKDADLFPNLQYRTIGDDRVRDEHDKLDGIIKPLNDVFWDSHYPPNGFRCRCGVQQTSKPATKGIPKIKIDKGFANNVGKTGEVFDQNGHPYFNQTINDSGFRENFELMKLQTPMIKTKGIEVSPWADPIDLKENLKAAILIRKRIKDAVVILPHIYRKKWKNPELKINNNLSDLKDIKGYSGVKNGLKASRAQGVTAPVFNLDNIKSFSVDKIIRELQRNIHKNRGRSIRFVYLIRAQKAVKISREQILNSDFKEVIKRLKSTENDAL